MVKRCSNFYAKPFSELAVLQSKVSNLRLLFDLSEKVRETIWDKLASPYRVQDLGKSLLRSTMSLLNFSMYTSSSSARRRAIS